MPWGKAKIVDVDRRGGGGDALEMVERQTPLPGTGGVTHGVSKEGTDDHVVDIEEEAKRAAKEEQIGKADDEKTEVKAAKLSDYTVSEATGKQESDNADENRGYSRIAKA